MFDDKSPFDIFNIKPGFAIDSDELERQYLALQAQFHPDKYIGQNPDEVMQATEQSSVINKAYQTLKNPLTRAGLLASQPTSNNPEILMAAMELREAIESATNLTQIYNEVSNKIKAIEDQFDKAICQPHSVSSSRTRGSSVAASDINTQQQTLTPWIPNQVGDDGAEVSSSPTQGSIIDDLYLQMQYLYKAKIEIKNKMLK